LRCEALLSLSAVSVPKPEVFLTLLADPHPDITIEAARTFRVWLSNGTATDCARSIATMQLSNDVAERLFFATENIRVGKPDKRPDTNDEWERALTSGGSPGRGRRVFLSNQATCSSCHAIDGRGGALGPDLSKVAQSKTRVQIINAILNPSAEFPPQYQAWLVVTTDGATHRGLQLDHKAQGAIELLTDTGKKVRFDASEIEEYIASPTSLMPNGLAGALATEELKDLVAFLSTLR